MSDLPEPDRFIDLTGLKCPLPVLRTKKALSGMEPGAVLKVVTSDPTSSKDIPAFAEMSGHSLLHAEHSEKRQTFYLRR